VALGKTLCSLLIWVRGLWPWERHFSPLIGLGVSGLGKDTLLSYYYLNINGCSRFQETSLKVV
jgi:hypothetical protein